MITPQPGQWYTNQESGLYFEVVALDNHQSTIEIQHADGSVDEIDAELWSELPIAQAAPPEDPTSAFDQQSACSAHCGIDGDQPTTTLDINTLEPDVFQGTDEDGS